MKQINKPMISFNNEEINFTVKHKTVVKKWLINTIEKNNKEVGDLNFIFCTDEFLYKLNKQFLNHESYTDVITFDYTPENKTQAISGDIYISIRRVEENANTFHKSFENEFHRVMIHGVLHLLGYKDKSKVNKEKMTAEEDVCLREFEIMNRKPGIR